MTQLLFDRIKDIAKRNKNMSVKELGIELQFGENAIYTWKKSNPSVDKLEKVSNFLNVSTDYLLGRTDNPYVGQTPEQRQLTIEEALRSAMGKDGEPIAEEDIPVLKRIIDAYLDGE